MRSIPPSMQAQLDAGVTTFCHCWRIDPLFAASIGFTDHDEDIAFDDVVFEAASAFQGTSIERSLGLAIDNLTATGALQSERIREEDIDGGVYDGAAIRLWLVDWRAPASRLLLFKGEIGEITHGSAGFEVELRGLSEPLNRPIGRRFLKVCDAEVGDGRCGFDTQLPGFRGEGTIESISDSRNIRAAGLSEFEDRWFDDGVLTWTSGRNAGRRSRIRSHLGGGDTTWLEFLEPPVLQPEQGDAFSIVAGCDKRAGTCRSKFMNFRNFRGFPYIPGDSWIAAHPAEGMIHDGGRRGS
ncbi:MAG: DUF2163 domain-containing protein [Pikeienuella sp.]|uniref:DUF2163 domain-containing protein n=1 Tax=Pikeienuella sp. TaxID=2831957 RepID=UPI00391D7ABE